MEALKRRLSYLAAANDFKITFFVENQEEPLYTLYDLSNRGI